MVLWLGHKPDDEAIDIQLPALPFTSSGILGWSVPPFPQRGIIMLYTSRRVARFNSLIFVGCHIMVTIVI